MSSDFIPPDFISLSVSIWESDIVAFKLSVVPVPYKGNKGERAVTVALDSPRRENSPGILPVSTGFTSYLETSNTPHDFLPI